MQFGRYQILDELGKGSMGIVYKAHDPQIDRPVALKVLRQDRINEEFIQRFLIEARAIGKLSHPNIVTVYDTGEDQGNLFIAMELLAGKSLKDVARSENLHLQKIAYIGAQVAEALNYAHQQGIIHRDIKPSNIILGSDSHVKITDFGIARIEDSSGPQQTQAGAILGTPVYMSPEQVMAKPVDGRSDLYSLGVILYELVTGGKPFRGDSIAVIFNSIIQDDPSTPELSDDPSSRPLSELIMKSISKAPQDRFQSGSEMAKPLKACLQRRKSDTREAEPRPAKTGRLGLFAVIGLVLAVFLGGSVYFFYPAKTRDPVSNKAAKKDGLPAVQAMLKVGSQPIGAQVFLSGVFKGKTPLRLNLPLGKYEVRLSLHGYYNWEAQLQLSEAGEMPLNVNLIPME